MTGVKHVFLLFLAASTLVVSAYSEAAAIRYDVTNATSVQNGYSLSGYIEVSGTGTISSLSSFNLTATKPSESTLTFDSGTSTPYNAINLFATASALYVPDSSLLTIGGEEMFIGWINNYLFPADQDSVTLYQAGAGILLAWDSNSYDNTDVNGWRIGSAQAAPSSVPEIDPNSLGSVLALVLGSLGLLERRRLKAA